MLDASTHSLCRIGIRNNKIMYTFKSLAGININRMYLNSVCKHYDPREFIERRLLEIPTRTNGKRVIDIDTNKLQFTFFGGGEKCTVKFKITKEGVDTEILYGYYANTTEYNESLYHKGLTIRREVSKDIQDIVRELLGISADLIFELGYTNYPSVITAPQLCEVESNTIVPQNLLPVTVTMLEIIRQYTTTLTKHGLLSIPDVDTNSLATVTDNNTLAIMTDGSVTAEYRIENGLLLPVDVLYCQTDESIMKTYIQLMELHFDLIMKTNQSKPRI